MHQFPRRHRSRKTALPSVGAPLPQKAALAIKGQSGETQTHHNAIISKRLARLRAPFPAANQTSDYEIIKTFQRRHWRGLSMATGCLSGGGIFLKSTTCEVICSLYFRHYFWSTSSV